MLDWRAQLIACALQAFASEGLSGGGHGRVAELAGQYLARLDDLKQKAGKPDALRVVDKLPDNYSLLGWILTLFPNARIIHCRRDPRAVALSCWMTQFGSICWACQEHHLVERIRQYRRLMDHWMENLDLPILDVDYEELVNDLENVSRRMVRFGPVTSSESAVFSSPRPASAVPGSGTTWRPSRSA